MKQFVLFIASAIMIISCGRGNTMEGSDLIILNYQDFNSLSFDNQILDRWDIDFLILHPDSFNNGLLSQIGKIVYEDGNYYVTDHKHLYRFASNGLFEYEIGMIGRSGSEYLTITDFSIDSLGNVVIIDGINDVFLRYGLDGSFISKLSMCVEWGNLHFCNGKGNVLLGREVWDRSMTNDEKLVLCDSSFVIQAVYSKFLKDYDCNVVFPHIGFSDYKGFVSYVNPIDDNICVYDIKQEKLTKVSVYYGKDQIDGQMLNNIEAAMSEIVTNKSFLINGIYWGEQELFITSFSKGNLVDEYVDIERGVRYNLSDAGLHFTGASKDRLFLLLDPTNYLFFEELMPKAPMCDVPNGGLMLLVLKSK